MSAIKLNSSGGGSITISPASTASNLTLTAPAQTGTIGLDGPAFSAYPSTNQNVTATTFTKINLNSELFDTNSNFDVATYRFTPTVAGYYQISCRLAFATVANMTDCFASLYKNGAEYARLGGAATGGTSSVAAPSGATIVYMNGSTDYLELYGYQSNATNTTLQTNAFGPASTYLCGALIRGA